MPKLIIKHNKNLSELLPNEEIRLYQNQKGEWVEELVKINESNHELI